MRKTFLLGLTLAAALAAAAPAAFAQSQPSKHSQDFIKQTIEGNLAEGWASSPRRKA